MKVLLAHPGTQHSFHLARELDRQGSLAAFYTGIAFRPDGVIARLGRALSTPHRKGIGNRILPDGFSAAIQRRPIGELRALWQLRRGMDEQTVLHRRNESFQRSISDEAIAETNAVIGVDTAGWILADRCRNLGRPFLLDQSIGHPDAKQAMHNEMRSAFPEWTEDSEQRRLEVRDAEIKEQTDATAIVTASSFAKQTLVENGVPAEKIHVIPYGVDTARFSLNRSTVPRPFRFVFVGLLTARKGIPLLLQTWSRLAASGAELWLIGPASDTARTLIPRLNGLRQFGSVSQPEVSRLLSECDIFVFPSFFEGFGLVLLEAMACGLPVITTTATAGPDIVKEGEDGWVIHPGDLDGLVNAMQRCLDHRDRVSKMGLSARKTAERFTWGAYGDRWVETLRNVAGIK